MSRRPTTTPSNRIERRAERQARQPGGAPPPRRQRPTHSEARRGPSSINWVPFAIALGSAAVIILIVYAVVSYTTASTSEVSDSQKALLDDNPLLPGVYYAPHPGPDGLAGNSDDRLHFGNGVVQPICSQEQIDSGQVFDPVCYTSNPPTSGPHASSPMAFGVLQNPAPKENLIHNMEHGGVVVWYNTDDANVVRELESVVREQYNDRRRLVVMSRYDGMESNTIALTSWTRLDKFPVGDFEKKRVTDFIEEHQRRFNPEGL